MLSRRVHARILFARISRTDATSAFSSFERAALRLESF